MKGLRFKLHGNNYGNLYGNYHDNHGNHHGNHGLSSDSDEQFLSYCSRMLAFIKKCLKVRQKLANLAKLTLPISHLLTLDMLNKFCFHLYAQKSLFIAENCNAFF